MTDLRAEVGPAVERNRGIDPSVAAPRHRLDKPRRPGVVAKYGAQPLHRGVQAVLEIDERAVRPEPTPQLVPCDQRAGTGKQEPHDLKRLLL